MKRTKTSASAWWKVVCRDVLMIGLAAVVVPTAAQTVPTRVTYYYTDPQGTVLATADEAGNVTAASDYRPYGAQALGTPKAAPGYTGHVNDPDLGLVYMQARYYEPVTGRFPNIDPVGPAPGNIYSFNRYAYASDNPVNNVDPDGRENCPGQSRMQCAF